MLLWKEDNDILSLTKNLSGNLKYFPSIAMISRVYAISFYKNAIFVSKNINYTINSYGSFAKIP